MKPYHKPSPLRGELCEEKPTFYLRKNIRNLSSVGIAGELLSPREEYHLQGDGTVRSPGGRGGAGAFCIPAIAKVNQVPERPLLPKPGTIREGQTCLSLTGESLPTTSLLREVPAGFSGQPHPAQLPASRLPLPAIQAATAQAPLPISPPWAGHEGSGQSLRPGPPQPSPGSAVAPVPLPGRSRPPAAQRGGSPQCQACVFVV